VSDIEYPSDLLELERAAWAAIQAGTLTADQAHAVQDRITEWATEAGLDRHIAEMALKRAVRHPAG
jgi:hypothetical protein